MSTARRFANLVRLDSPRSFLIAASVFLTSTMTAGAAQAAGIAWHGNFQAAAQQAAAQRKPLLVMVKASWCGPCHKMLKQTFPDPALAARINSHFIPVLIDADEQAATVQALGISAFPTVVVLSPDRKVMSRLTGFQSAAQLDTRLAALTPAPIRAFAPPQIRRWNPPAPGQMMTGQMMTGQMLAGQTFAGRPLTGQPPAPRQYGTSFLQRHAIASLPFRPAPMRPGLFLPRPGLADSQIGPTAFGMTDTLSAAREFSASGVVTPSTMAATPMPNPPD